MDDDYDPFKDLAKIDDEHLSELGDDKRDHFDPFKASDEPAKPAAPKKINRDEMLTAEDAANAANKQAEALGEFAKPTEPAEPFPEAPLDPAAATTAEAATPPEPAGNNPIPPELGRPMNAGADSDPSPDKAQSAGDFDNEPLVADLPHTPPPETTSESAAATQEPAGNNPIPPELGNPIPPELGSDPALDQTETSEQGATPEQSFNTSEAEEEVPELFDDDMRNYIEKGESVDLTELDQSLRHIIIGVGWDQRKVEEQMADIDLSVFLLNTNNMTNLDEDFVFYNNTTDLTESAKHLGDNRTGAGEGDDEQIEILLTGLSYEASRISCVLSIYDDEFKGITFDIAKNIYIRIMNKETGEEIIRFNIPDEDLAGKSATYLASIVREGPNWIFEAESNSVEGSLADIATEHGLVIKELQSTG